MMCIEIKRFKFAIFAAEKINSDETMKVKLICQLASTT